MHVLTVNCGSSSLKVALYAAHAGDLARVARGAVEGFGPEATVVFEAGGGAASRVTQAIGDYAGALRVLLALAGEERGLSIKAVGHRVVQGGLFVDPIVVDDGVLAAIESGRRLAPLHNGPSLEGIRAAQELLPGVPMVAVFDTAFHATIPEVAREYALPHELARLHGLRRYGYHGIAHRSMVERYAELTGAALRDVSLITLQLGNGCSAAAVAGGVCVDTSMGFTPVGGLLMSTRSGDIDPGALLYLAREAELSPDELDEILNHRSGLLGVSGTSGDMAKLLAREAQGDARAHAAIEMFCYRVRAYIGAYLAVLGGAEAIVFGGGIGERSAEIRRRVCESLRPLGVDLDLGRNAAADGDGRISGDGSAIAAWVIGSDEERIIARDTVDVLARARKERGT